MLYDVLCYKVGSLGEVHIVSNLIVMPHSVGSLRITFSQSDFPVLSCVTDVILSSKDYSLVECWW